MLFEMNLAVDLGRRYWDTGIQLKGTSKARAPCQVAFALFPLVQQGFPLRRRLANVNEIKVMKRADIDKLASK